MQRLKRPKYQVEVFDPSWDGSGRVGWVADGPVFTNKKDAKAYMDALDEYPGTVRIKAVASFPARSNKITSSTQKTLLGKNCRNGDASIEVVPGIFATYDAYQLLQELGCVNNFTKFIKEDPVAMLQSWLHSWEDDDLPY